MSRYRKGRSRSRRRGRRSSRKLRTYYVSRGGTRL